MNIEDVILRAARHAAPALRRAGMEVDDCAQEARLYLHTHTLPEDATEQYVYTVCWRAMLRAGRKVPVEYVEAPALDAIEAKSTHATTMLYDLIENADDRVREYLTCRVLAQATWDETRALMGESNASLASIRHAAADWLLEQFEGTINNGGV